MWTRHWTSIKPSFSTSHCQIKRGATYLTQVRQFCTYLKQGVFEYGHPLKEDHARDYAVRDYKTQLKTVHRRKPSTINLMLAAVDHFYRFLQMDQAVVRRGTTK